MKNKIIVVLFLISNTIFGQLPVTDVAANSNLILINDQITLLLSELGSLDASALENTLNNAENLSESITQSETMVSQLEEVKNIQKELGKVKQAIKDAKQVKESLINIVKIIRDTNYILTQTNTLTYRDGSRVFSSNEIDQINYVFDTVLNTVNGFMDIIQKVIKDDVFKMDEGNRIDLVLKMAEKIKTEYTKIHRKRIEFENSFKILNIKPIKG